VVQGEEGIGRLESKLVFPDPGPYEYMIHPGDLVFDIGACIGQMTEFYLSRGARVIAVEPESGDVEQLEERFGLNEMVTIIHKAVGSQLGRKHLYLHGGASSVSTFIPIVWWGRDSAFHGTEGTGWEEVEMVTLDSLIEEYGLPQFIKLDIEGYESFALRGLSHIVPFVQFEICAATIKSGQVQECFERLLHISPNAQFNYTLTEGPCFMIGSTPRWHWTSAEEVMETIGREMEKWPLFWGNGFANMVEDNLD
jgi:FkbM family methyltransferase